MAMTKLLTPSQRKGDPKLKLIHPTEVVDGIFQVPTLVNDDDEIQPVVELKADCVVLPIKTVTALKLVVAMLAVLQ